MKYSNTVEYNIKTSLDSKGLTQLKSELQGLELKLQNMGNKGLLDEKTFVDARNQIQGLGQALTDAFNPSLGMLDLSKLNQELKNNDVTAQGLKTAFSSLGAEGQVAFNNLVGELGKLDTGILRTNSQIDKLFTTFSNTFRWGLVSSFFSQFMNAIHSSIDYVKELDDSLTQIMLVTDYNKDSMNEFARSANEAAKAVSMTTTGMTNASLIFAQQGYNLGQSQELATLSAKLANASQQDTATTSDQITAYMNAYGLENSIGELTQAMDNWALIANISAADVSELAQASQRAASMANTVGVSGEQLAAQIATIESVTREAPEQIGNGLKTLYARFSDISAGGEDEEGVSLGDVTKQLNDIGVRVLDQFGNIRDVGDIMEDLMVVWDDLDQTSKIAAAQSLAGKYQVNRFVSLMDNSDMYREYLGATGSSATGTLDQMSEEVANSIEGRSAKLQASLEGLFSTIFNTDDIYPWMDAAQGAIDLLQQFFDALGGGKTVLLGITSLLMQIFSKNMAQEINNAVTNRAVQQQKLENLQNSQAALTTLGAANPNPNDANSQNILNFAQYMQANAKNFNAEQMDQANSILQELVQNSNAATMAADKLKESLSVIGTGITATTGESILAPFLDSEGAVNATLLSEALQNMSQSEVAEMFSHIQEDIRPARESLLEFNKALQDYQQELRNANSTDDSWSQSLSNLKATLDNLEGKIDPSTYERYEQAVNEIAEVTDKAGDKTAETTAEVAKLADGLEKVAAKDLTNLDQLNKDAFQAKNTQMAAEDSNKVAGAFQEGMGSQAYIQEILNTMNAVQQLTFAWQAFQNLGSLWANEDLSTGEKVLQTIMNLTMAMPQLISAMQTLQGNSFLQNIGNGLIGALNGTLPTIGDFEILAKGEESASQLEFLKGIIETGDQAKAVLGEVTEAGGEFAPQLLEMVKNGDEARKVLGEIGPVLEKDAEAGEVAKTALSSMSGVMGKAMATAAAEGATGLSVLGAGLKAVAAEAWAFITGPAAPFIIAGAAIAAIAVAIGQAQQQAKEAHEQAMADFEDAKNAQQQVADLSAKIDDWQSKRNEQGNTKELAQDADALADSLKELGNEEEAAAVHLAAVRAEVLGTAESFEKLDQAMEKAQLDSQDNMDLATMEAANAILRDRLSTTEELAAANKDLQNAALDYNLRQASKTNGWEMGILNTPGDDDIRAATMDWQSLNNILEQSVPGFAEITDENERLSLALAHTSDEAQRAAIQIQQMLNTSNILSDDQKTGITRQLESAGFSAQEALQVIASLNIDEETSYNNIIPEIQDIIQRVNEDKESLSVVLQAKMDPEQIKETVKSQIATYEPKDEDINKEDFDSLADTFYENKNQMGVEGTPFEDFSENLFENAEGLEDVIEGILRYNDAIESLNKNYDNWKDVLENTNELSTEHLQVVEGLQETYSDFLGLSRDVSKRFASNAKNLELMQEAAEGDTEAFENLEDAAAADIYMQVTGLEDLDAAQQKIEEINDILANSGIEEIPVGEVFNLDDFESVRSAIDSELQALGLNAEQAAQYVSDVWHLDIPADQFTVIDDDMNAAAASAESTATHVEGVVEGVTDTVLDNANYSVSTDIDSDTAEATDTVTFTNLTPQPIGPVSITSMMPVGNGNTGVGGGVHMEPFVAQTYGVGYTPETRTAEQLKQQTGFKEDVKAEKGGKGGHVSLPSGSGATGSRRPSGGSGRSGVSRPSSGGGRGGGGGKRSCFVAGTLITTQTSFKPIEQIQKGDIVLSYNEQIGFNQYSKVVQTMIHDTIEPIYTLYIKNEQLRVTGIHRFFVTDKITCGIPQWVCAADLHVGQWVLFADGTWHVIHKIKINIEHQTVYNFEVSGNHNYYVGRNQILAHNKGGGSGGKGSTPKTIEPKEKKDHQKDYYEEVKNQLDKTEKVLSKIEKEEDRLIGDEARANQNRQIKFLEKEIKLNEKKLKINKQELKDVDDKIKKEIELAKAQAGQYGVNANIPEIKYDEDGVISNYEEISAAIDRIHNELIDKYNAAAAASNEELTKEIQKAIDKFDKYGDNVLKNAQRHNALQSEIEETKNTLEELQDAIEDIRIEAKHAAMEAIDDIKDLNKSMAELDGFFSGFKLDSAKRDLTELGSELDSVFNNDNAVNYYNNLIAEQDKMIEKAKEAVKTAKDAEEKEKAQALLESRTLTRNALIEQRDRAQNALNSGQEWKGGILGLQQQHVEDLTKRLEAFNNAELNGKEYVDPIFGKNKAALMEYLEEARSGLADTLIQVEELVEDFRSSLIDLYDESADKQQKLQDEFDRQTEKLETRMDWYTLYYGDEAYDAMNQFYTKEGELLAAQSRRRKADADFWYAEAEKLKIKSQQQGIELDKEQYDHLLDLAKEAESESEELATKSAEAFKDAFDKAIDAVGQKFYRTIFSNINRDVNGAPEAFANSVFNNNRIYDTSYLGITDNNGNPITQASLTDFNDIKTKWELQKDYSSKYRDNMERSYEIDKLRAKYMDILNNAQNMSLQTQNKIRAQMQDQLDYLKGQTTLSEYDVKLANARLEILQKQIALEEAQRNKNKMQLRRDTQGNYRYVYTADKGDTDKAQQELDDSLFDAYEITKEQSLQNVDSLLSSLQNYMEQRSEILRRYSANDAETAQKRAAALAMLDEEYKQIWTALGEDFSDTMQGLDEVLTWTIENGNANTVEAASEMLDAVNNHNYDILGEMNASWIGWSDDMRFNVLPAISEATQEAMVESEVAVRDFAEHLVGPEGILPELNSGINSYKDILDKTKQSTNELAKASEELATALNADSIEFQKKTEQLIGYQQQLNNTKNTTSKLRDELNKARELLEKEKKKTAALTQGIKDIAAGTAVAGADGSVKGKSKPGGSGTKNSGKWHVGDRVGFHGWYNYTSWGQKPAGNLWSDQENAVVISDFSDTSVGGTQSTGEYTIHLETPQGGWLGWVRPDQLFDTGGYTGQWSDGDKNAKNGKWAMLHEKELVLNANDTENILQAVNMLRRFTNALGISKLSLNGLTTNQGQIEQRVEINASFPNVHSAEDVEAALLEIADQAYIYAHKD